MGKSIKYTATGDDGHSNLLGEGRFPKSDLRFEVIGSLDECSAVIGLAKATINDQEIKDILSGIQRDLYRIMGEISILPDTKISLQPIPADFVKNIESVIDQIGDEVEIPHGFILPGDTIESGLMDVSRTVIRRAERRLTQMFDAGEMDNVLIRQYINRLSSLFFLLELLVNKRKGTNQLTMAK